MDGSTAGQNAQFDALDARLVTLLAERLHLPKRAITILRGAASRDKQIALTGITADELRARLTP